MTVKQLFIMLVALIGFVSSANAQYTFYNSTGRFESTEGWSVMGYSGRNVNSDGYDYRNRAESVRMIGVGVIPEGMYYIVGVNSSITSNTIVLSLDPANDMYGRSGFRIHGDNSNNNASKGCIILDAGSRARIASAFNSRSRNDAILTVRVYR